MIFYAILVKEVGESKGGGSILEMTVKKKFLELILCQVTQVVW